MQELTGTALNEFLLRKSGKKWDEVIEPTATLADINEESVKIFLADAKKAGRIEEGEGLSTTEILTNLRLIDEQVKLKRAALVLFGKNPGKFYNNCVVKIGRFGKDDTDLKFQEQAEGNIIQLLKEVPDLLNKKFLIKPIDFEGLQRIEKGEYPVAALREMLLNALVHRYYLGTVIQIKVYDNRISIWNEGTLPEGMNLDSLKRPHPSRPRNPLIADVCFKGGYIELWGRGTLKIINSCKEAWLPDPGIVEGDGGLFVTLFKDRYTEEQLRKMGLNERQVKAVLFVMENGSITNTKYVELFNMSRQTATRDLTELINKFKVLRREGVGAGVIYYMN